MKRSQVALLLLAGGIFLSGTVLEKIYAQSATTVGAIRRDPRIPIEISVLKGHVDWLAACPSGYKRSLFFKGTYIQPKNQLVGYVSGGGGLFPSPIGELTLQNGMLSGEGKQYFNDRTYKMPPPPAPASAPDEITFDYRPNNPFNPEATDRLGLSIDPATGKAKITLLSWGDGIAEMQLEYKNGIFYGFPQAGGMHAFVFKRFEQDIRRPK